MFEQFPYADMHQLNLDWIIKIAKDFLDQYTHIQEIIETGQEELQNTYTRLSGLLDAWYETHSEDIANELAEAIQELNAWYDQHVNYLDQTLVDFTAAAEAKAQQVIESIPDDYSELAQTALKIKNHLALSNTAPSVLSDCNNAVANTLYHFVLEPAQAASQRPSNFPEAFAYDVYDFLLLTLQAAYQSGGWQLYKVQYVLDANHGSIIAVRSFNGSTWSAWEATGETITALNRLAFAADAVNIIPDFDTMKNFILYQINVANASQLPANAPAGCPLNCFALSLDYSFSPGNYTLTQRRQFILQARTLRPLFMRDITSNATGVAWNRIADRFVVAADGSGDYTTLTAAVNAAVSGDTIYIKKGIYNGETAKAGAKNLTIIGEDKYQTIIRNTLNDYSNPPLEMATGYLSNLTLFAEDTGTTPPQAGPGYALHIENNALADSSMFVKDVVFKSSLAQACGIGLRPGCQVTFEDCEFWSDRRAGLFYHDSANGTVGVQQIKFQGCTFYTARGTASLMVRTQKWTGTTVYNTFINCSLANEAGTTPAVDAAEATEYTGTATGPIGDFYNLINFFKGKLSAGNNVPDLNYVP